MTDPIDPSEIVPQAEPDHGDDMLFTSKRVHLSLRGILTGIVVITTCGMSLFGIPVLEPLYSVTLISIGWYFGRSQRKQP